MNPEQMIQEMNAPQQDTSSDSPTVQGGLTPQQMQKIIGIGNNLTPDQTSAVLGHANGMLQNTFNTPLTEFASGQGGDAQQHALGAGKQLLSDISSAGAQNAGPVGKAMLANAPAFAKDIQAAQGAMQPTTPAQQQGAAETSLAEAAIPIGAASESGLLSKIADKLGISDFLSSKRVAATADVLTKKELEVPGRVAASGKIIPSATEARAGALMKGKTSINPVKTQAAIAEDIATRGKEAETYLKAENTPITNKEDYDAFQAIRSSSSKYMTPAEQKAYDEQIGVFQGILKGKGEYNTANYYEALKEYESQVTANLPKGKDALLVPGGSARIQAAKDVRSVVRNMIGEKNPAFKGKMYDLASLYDAQDNVSARVAEKAKQSTTFAKRHPVITKGAKYGAEAAIGGAVYEEAKNLGAPVP